MKKKGGENKGLDKYIRFDIYMHNKDGRVCLFSRDDGWRGERVSTSQDDGVVCT